MPRVEILKTIIHELIERSGSDHTYCAAIPRKARCSKLVDHDTRFSIALQVAKSLDDSAPLDKSFEPLILTSLCAMHLRQTRYNYVSEGLKSWVAEWKSDSGLRIQFLQLAKSTEQPETMPYIEQTPTCDESSTNSTPLRRPNMDLKNLDIQPGHSPESVASAQYATSIPLDPHDVKLSPRVLPSNSGQLPETPKSSPLQGATVEVRFEQTSQSPRPRIPRSPSTPNRNYSPSGNSVKVEFSALGLNLTITTPPSAPYQAKETGEPKTEPLLSTQSVAIRLRTTKAADLKFPTLIRVASLIRQPIKIPLGKKKTALGYVYVLTSPLTNPHTPLSKIGSTCGSVRNRMTCLERECKQLLMQQKYNGYDTPVKFSRRAEALAHAELKHYRSVVKCQHGSRVVDHREWFAISHEIATECVERWRAFLAMMPYGEDGILKDMWQKRLDEVLKFARNSGLPDHDRKEWKMVWDWFLRPFDTV